MVMTKRTRDVTAARSSMPPYVGRFVDRVRDAEAELEREIKGQQRQWQSRAHRGLVWFDRELRDAHRRLRQSIPAYVLEGNISAF
jgi:hypothetical protein